MSDRGRARKTRPSCLSCRFLCQSKVHHSCKTKTLLLKVCEAKPPQCAAGLKKSAQVVADRRDGRDTFLEGGPGGFLIKKSAPNHWDRRDGRDTFLEGGSGRFLSKKVSPSRCGQKRQERHVFGRRLWQIRDRKVSPSRRGQERRERHVFRGRLWQILDQKVGPNHWDRRDGRDTFLEVGSGKFVIGKSAQVVVDKRDGRDTFLEEGLMCFFSTPSRR
jgi:hypothetical protein